jgi:hypothetical protein
VESNQVQARANSLIMNAAECYCSGGTMQATIPAKIQQLI